MSTVGSTTEVSSAAVNKCVQIDIRDKESGKIEYTCSVPRSQELRSLYTQVWNAFNERTGREDLFRLELDGREIEFFDTPSSLEMSDRVELMYCPIVIVVVYNFWTRKEERRWRMHHNTSFSLLKNVCIGLKGNDGFDLSYNGRRLKLNETPSSLGMKHRVELLCIPVPVITIVLKYMDTDGLPSCEHEVVMRRDEQFTKLGLIHKEAGIFMYDNRKLSLQETPDSLYMLSDRVEISCVPSSSVIIDIFNVETQKVEWTMTLGSASYFSHIFMECEKRRPHYKYGSGSIFYLECDMKCAHPGCSILHTYRIDQNDTPNSLKMAEGDRVVLSYTPNPVVEIDLHMDEECECTFMRTFRLKPNQPLRTIFNAYSDMWFLLFFNGSSVRREATPESLGMKPHEKLVLHPVVVIDVFNHMNQDEDAFDLARTCNFRTLYETYKKKGSYESPLDFYFKGVIIDLDKDTPESLGMEAREEVECVPQFYEKPPEKEESSTIDIAFKTSSDISRVVLQHGYDEQMKTLLSRYAERKNVPLKSLRFKYDGKILFMSSIGKKSPYDLGMRHNDVIYVSLLEEVDMNEAETTKKSRPSGARKGKAKSKKKKRKKASNQPSYSTMNEEERLRREHSEMLTTVFDEANPQFKEIRQKLNSLALEQTPPKLKSSPPRACVSEPKEVKSDILSWPLDNKTIKTRFNVLVGEVSNLYKSTKKTGTHNNKASFTIDLRGFTKGAAVAELDTSLPSWIDAAMHGDYPFVIPVTIICGAGGQVLSEVVEKWIRENERVANARKNMF